MNKVLVGRPVDHGYDIRKIPMRGYLRRKRCIGQIVGYLMRDIKIVTFCQKLSVDWQQYVNYLTGQELPTAAQMQSILSLARVQSKNQRYSILALLEIHRSSRGGFVSDMELYNIRENFPTKLYKYVTWVVEEKQQ